jgi:hypothetical protein
MELIFVYNADSSLGAQLKDYAHKAVSPSTYECSLCQITYGGLGMKGEWKDFLKTLPQEVVFLHRDELHAQYPDLKGVKFPVVLKKEGDKLSEFISAEEINQQKTISDLKTLVSQKLAADT